MGTTFWLGMVFAIAASSCLNVGKGIQKWKVAVLGHGRGMFRREHRRDLAVWLVGVGLTTVATPLYSIALKFSDKPSTVSALNGVGLIGLVIFAWLVIGERVGKREVFGALLIIAGTAVMGAFDLPSANTPPTWTGFVACFVAIVVVYVPLGLFSWRTGRWHGQVFGSLAGALIGVAMVLGDVALVTADDDLLGQLAGPWAYLALLVGSGALAITQLAFWRATAMVVVPTVNSFVVLTPAVLQYFTFGTLLSPLQYVGIAVIIVGVVVLTMVDRAPADEVVPAPAV